MLFDFTIRLQYRIILESSMSAVGYKICYSFLQYERRNVYAGGIQRNVTKRDLIRRFECFGPVEKVTLHFREKG